MESAKKGLNGGKNWEYLFRGFQKDEEGKEKVFVAGEWIKGYWVYGNLRKQADGTWEIGEQKKGAPWIRVLPETVGIKSGDRHHLSMDGKGVFRGDIIKGQGEEQCPGAVVEYDGQYGLFRRDSQTLPPYIPNETIERVAGNRWSNPELVEATENRWDWEYLFRGFYESWGGERLAFINGEWTQGCWIYGNLRKDQKGNCAIEDRACPGKFIKVFPETVGLCAEMRDKNGRPICDGDIVKTKSDVDLIEYYGGGYCESNDGNPLPIGEVGSFYEVIGNKWEKPELLLDREKAFSILEYEEQGKDIVSYFRDKKEELHAAKVLTERLHEMKASAEKEGELHKRQRRQIAFWSILAGWVLGYITRCLF